MENVMAIFHVKNSNINDFLSLLHNRIKFEIEIKEKLLFVGSLVIRIGSNKPEIDIFKMDTKTHINFCISSHLT